MSFGIKLRVWGEYACFTRPEMKVERVSYDVITPSAARGIIEAIYWKPSIKWIIDRIHVLKDIRFKNIRRNELGCKISSSNIKKVMKKPSAALQAFIEEDRQQRAATILYNVDYVIEAHFICNGLEDNESGKHLDIFNRRSQKGKCFYTPYLGCREFSAYFCNIKEDIPETSIKNNRDRDLGFMFYDIDFKNRMQPMFFKAQMKNGVIEVPGPETGEVMR